MSNRAIAEKYGMPEPTVRRARSGASNDAPDKRTGKDGKAYPARRNGPKPERRTAIETVERIAEMVLDEGKSYGEAGAEAGVSSTINCVKCRS